MTRSLFNENMKEEWLYPNATVLVDVKTTSALLTEIKRLRNIMETMDLAPRPWVDLTNEELDLIWLDCHGDCCLADGRILNYERALEAKLKEKNA